MPVVINRSEKPNSAAPTRQKARARLSPAPAAWFGLLLIVIAGIGWAMLHTPAPKPVEVASRPAAGADRTRAGSTSPRGTDAIKAMYSVKNADPDR
jgi:hypothetical protein